MTHWTYEQKTGKLYYGKTKFKSYSGKDDYKNKPAMQGIKNKGPIPRGEYKMLSPRNSPNTGPYVIPLEPVGHSALGRTAFQIHGESAKTIGNSSNGCIIINGAENRRTIWNSGVRKLVVIFGEL